MAKSNNLKDRHGMTISTSSPLAAEQWLDGVDLLVSQNFGADAKFNEAIATDDGFALPHAGLAYMLMLQGKAEEARASATQAEKLAPRITQRERNQVQGISLFVHGKGRDSLKLISRPRLRRCSGARLYAR